MNVVLFDLQLMNQLDGTGPPPAEKSQIESLPKVKITKEQVGECPNIHIQMCSYC